jgi:hypothetical protein
MKNLRARVIPVVIMLLGLAWLSMSAAAKDSEWLKDWQQKNKTWRAIHFTSLNLPGLKQCITEVLAPRGFNVLILEVDYRFQFKSHPELADPKGLTREQVRQLVEFGRRYGLRIVPLLNCVGHQSPIRGKASALLKAYPQFDETPTIPQENRVIYCREWCPLHPDVNEVVFALMDELIDAFDADALHVGMDEIFLVGFPPVDRAPWTLHAKGDPFPLAGYQPCPRCKGKSPGVLLAKAINDFHAHLVDQRQVEMLMWGDRLIDGHVMDDGECSSSYTGSHIAIDLIPQDVIQCDWHYGLREDYPSVRFFQQKGFRVLPSPWQGAKPARALRECARKDATDKLLGMLFTGWGVDPSDLCRAFADKDVDVSNTTKGVVAAIKACVDEPTAR